MKKIKRMKIFLLFSVAFMLMITKVEALESDNNISHIDSNLENGLSVSFKEPGTSFAWTKVMPIIDDWSNSEYLLIRVKNGTSVDSPLQFSLHEKNSEIFATNQDDVNLEDYVLFIDEDDNVVDKKIYWGNVWIPANFDGTLAIPFTSFNDIDSETGDNVLDLADIYAMFIGVNIQFNSFENLFFGEVGVYSESNGYSQVIDIINLTEEQFTSQIVVDPDENSQKTVIRRTKLEDIIELVPAPTIGDIKILDQFDFDSDESLNSSITTWDGGAQMNLSLGDNGYLSSTSLDVLVGEATNGQNIYGSINIMPYANISNWKNWNDGGENSDQVAEGITFYIKNNSQKEVTINFEFDEFTDGNFGPDGEDYTHERYSIKYGARILLHSVDGNEFIVHSKPVFAIPVDFEGWVRIPFESFSVSSWCTWGNSVLELDKPIDGIFITSNSLLNQGLSFSIDDIGVYYNETSATSLFHNPDNSLTNNLTGGGE